MTWREYFQFYVFVFQLVVNVHPIIVYFEQTWVWGIQIVDNNYVYFQYNP